MSYKCIKCNKTFCNKQVYNKHLLTKSHKEREENKSSLFTCKCGKAFKYFPGLSRHKKTCNYIPTPENEPETEVQLQVDTSDNVSQLENIMQLFKSRLDEKDEENKKMRKEIDSLRKKVDLLIKKTTDNIKSSQKRCKIKANLRIHIKEKQNNTCGMCNKAITDIFELDHIIAIQFGGTNHEDNLMALCCECHRYKSNQETKYRQDIRQYIQNIIPKRSIEL